MANLDCEKILNLIPLYIDGMLSKEENDIVSRHLNSCENCKKEFEFIASLVSTAKDITEVPLPADFHKNLMIKAEKKARAKKAKQYLTLRHIGAGVVAAAVLALSVVAFGNIINRVNDENIDQYILQSPDVSDAPISREVNETSKTVDAREYKAKDNTNDTKTHITPNENSGLNQVKQNITEDFETSTGDKTEKEQQEIQSVIAVETDDEKSHIVATVTSEGVICEKVFKILSEYKKDEIGYQVLEIEEVLNRLKEIGAAVEIQESKSVTENYIIIK